MKAYDTLSAIVDRDRDWLADLVARMVRVPTVNPKFVADPALNQEPAHQELLRRELNALGFATELGHPFPDRPNLIGAWAGSEARSLTLAGHVDVVPEGDHDRWTRAPFGGEIAGGLVWGRGALDMKGGVACCLAAARAIREAGITLGGRLEIHAVVDEEAGAFGSRHLVDSRAVTEAAIVTEPTWGDVDPAEGGLDFVRVVIPGRNAHAAWRFNSIYPQRFGDARPEPGVNAAELGARFILAVRELERDWAMRKQHPLLPPGITTINPGVTIAGTGIGPDGRPAVLTNPAMIPDHFVADFHLKFLPQEDPAAVRAEFEAFVAAFAGTSDWLRDNPPRVEWGLLGVHFPPVDTPVDHPLVRSMLAARERLGLDPRVAGFTACSDAANYAAAGAASVIFGPSGDGMHGYDEHVEIDSLVATATVLAHAAIDWCGTR